MDFKLNDIHNVVGKEMIEKKTSQARRKGRRKSV